MKSPASDRLKKMVRGMTDMAWYVRTSGRRRFAGPGMWSRVGHVPLAAKEARGGRNGLLMAGGKFIHGVVQDAL